MSDKPLKRSLSVAGHRTSISLEPEFWTALNAMAQFQRVPVANIVATIDRERGQRNLSSAIRVWLLLNRQG